MSLELLLVVAFAGPLFTYILGKLLPRLREGCALLSALLPVIITACLYGRTTDTPLGISFLGLPIVLRINMLSWFKFSNMDIYYVRSTDGYWKARITREPSRF